jgi:hypothetical protein
MNRCRIALSLLSFTACLGIALTAAPKARAGMTVGFDDLSNPNSDYYKFNWNSIGIFNASPFAGQPGYGMALQSPDNVGYSESVTVSGFSSTNQSLFSFHSAYFASGFNDGLTIDVLGLRNGVQLFSTELVLSTAKTLYEVFDYTNIDEVSFVVVADGILSTNLPYGGFGSQFGMDDLTFDVLTANTAPAPPTLLLTLVGVAHSTLAGLRARRKKNASV